MIDPDTELHKIFDEKEKLNCWKPYLKGFYVEL